MIIHPLNEMQGTFIFSQVLVSMPVYDIADGIHSQTIHMILINPEGSRRHQEAAHLFSPEIEVRRSPLRIRIACLLIFIQRCPVKI